MRNFLTTGALTACVCLCSASRASAEWLVTPYAGLNWGAAATFNDFIGSYDDQFGQGLDFGAYVTWPKGPLEFEFDFGYHHKFMENRAGDDGALFPSFNWAASRVMTYMGNVNYSPGFLHAGKVRGFASGGAGMIHVHAEDALIPEFVTIDSRSFGFNAGGGVTVPFFGALQLRGDVRYFRSLADNQPASEVDTTIGKLYFWRGTVGVTIHF
jgi:Outer membrane protein beta-barrel domain